jgi:hypothetical protein
MICPNCHYEYVPGVTTCPDCGADLIFALPPKSAEFKAQVEPEQSTEVVIVFESDIGVDLAIAKEILDEAGIAYIAGRKPGIFYSAHKMIIQVAADDSERARSLLSELVESGSRLVDNFEMEEGGEDISDSTVTVFEPSDQSELSAARSILNRAGVDYNVVDNRDHKLGGPSTVEIQVIKSQADEAQKLLATLKNNGPSSEQKPEK